MNTSFKTGFEKIAGEGKLYHAAELLGLGALAIPSIYKMTTGKDIGQGKYHGLELGGLGVLAAPSILAMAGGRKGLKKLNPFRNKRVADLSNVKKQLNNLHSRTLLV